MDKVRANKIVLCKSSNKIIVHTPKADQEKQFANEDKLIEAFFLCVYNILGYEAFFPTRIRRC